MTPARIARVALRAVLAAGLLLGGPAWAQAEAPAGPPARLHVVSDDNYPPYLFLDAQGRPAGYLVDLWGLWEARTGIPVRLTATAWSEAQAMVQRGDADVIDMIYRTPAREPLYEFSPPYAELPVAIFRHASVTGLHDVGTLQGFQVGVQEGDACIEALARGGITSLKVYRNYAALIDAAQAQQVKVFCLDEHPANYYLYQRGLHQEFLKAFELYRGEFHRATRKGETATLALVERGMALVTEEEREALRNKWLGTPTDWRPVARHLALAGAVAVVLGGLLALWIYLLRRQVRRRTRELQDQRARLDAVLAAIPDLVWLKDLEGAYLGCNRQFERLYGVPEAQLRGRTDHDFVDRETADAFRFHDRRALDTGEPVKNEEWLTFADGGETRLFETVKTPFLDAQGQVVGVLGVARDITERRRAAEELERYRDRLQQEVAERTAELAQTAGRLQHLNEELDALFAAVPLGVVLVQNRLVLKCNPGVERIFGYEARALVGHSTRAWYPDDAAFQAMGDRLAATIERGEVFTTEIEMVRRGGQRFWASIVAQALDPRDPSRGSIATIEDITPKHEAAEALLRAKTLAEHAAQVKADFLANMSHEVRTPLNVILGMAHLVLGSDLPPRERERLQQIEASGRQLSRIISDILDLSDIESGRLVLEPRLFSLRETVGKVMRGVCEKARAKGLACHTELSEDLPDRLLGDDRRLAQVLDLLGDNAVKFTERGRVRLVVGLAAREAGRVRVRFAVEDTGIGLNAEQRQRLGQSFQQIDSSASRRYGGVGLGLAIGKRLLQLMGGEGGLDSEPGRGSTFWFTVDFEEHAAQGAEPAPGPAGAGGLPPAPAEPAPAIETPQDRDRLAAAVAELLPLLAAGDVSVFEAAQGHRDLLRRGLGAPYASFAQALEAFEFDRAAELLRQMARAHGITD